MIESKVREKKRGRKETDRKRISHIVSFSQFPKVWPRKKPGYSNFLWTSHMVGTCPYMDYHLLYQVL